MKTIQIILTITILSLPLAAQDSQYQETMLKTIEKLNTSTGNEDLLACSNMFERIASAEEVEWLPYYYGSQACIMMSFNEQDPQKKDLIVDRAQEMLDKAFALNKEESELHLLQAFLYPARILVDPMARGMIYMEKAFQSLEKANELNPENPRVYFLKGVNLLNMPPSMGGGAEVAKPLFIEAQKKFESFVPSSSLMPVWGEEVNSLELSKLTTQDAN